MNVADYEELAASCRIWRVRGPDGLVEFHRADEVERIESVACGFAFEVGRLAAWADHWRPGHQAEGPDCDAIRTTPRPCDCGADRASAELDAAIAALTRETP